MTRGVLLAVAVSLFAAAATSAPVLTDDALRAKTLEVAAAMGFTQAYRDPAEGLVVWRVKIAECPALFAWYMKRVDTKVAIDDPVLLMCGANPSPELRGEVRRFLDAFKRRWQAAVGNVELTAPTPGTHSQELPGVVLGLLSRETAARASHETLPGAPDGFTWRPLREINAVTLVPDGWHVKRVMDPKVTAAVGYFVTLEDMDGRGRFETGMTINVLIARSRASDVESVAKSGRDRACASQVIKPSWDVVDGIFHRYGCIVKMTGQAGAVVVDHRFIVNTATKTMYIVDFESPEARWTADAPTGAKLVNELLFDENV